MSYSLYWTPEARRTFDQNLEYLSQEWDSKVVSDFLDRVEESLEHIRQNPMLFPIHRKKDFIHKCIIHKRIVLYYKVMNSRIDLITFWNTYQEPNRLKL